MFFAQRKPLLSNKVATPIYWKRCVNFVFTTCFCCPTVQQKNPSYFRFKIRLHCWSLDVHAFFCGISQVTVIFCSAMSSCIRSSRLSHYHPTTSELQHRCHSQCTVSNCPDQYLIQNCDSFTAACGVSWMKRWCQNNVAFALFPLHPSPVPVTELLSSHPSTVVITMIHPQILGWRALQRSISGIFLSCFWAEAE